LIVKPENLLNIWPSSVDKIPALDGQTDANSPQMGSYDDCYIDYNKSLLN